MTVLAHQCINCAYYVDDGICCRFPPIRRVESDGFKEPWLLRRDRWPLVDEGDWCGEWKENEGVARLMLLDSLQPEEKETFHITINQDQEQTPE